jgi:hypothetical protein
VVGVEVEKREWGKDGWRRGYGGDVKWKLRGGKFLDGWNKLYGKAFNVIDEPVSRDKQGLSRPRFASRAEGPKGKNEHLRWRAARGSFSPRGVRLRAPRSRPGKTLSYQDFSQVVRATDADIFIKRPYNVHKILNRFT